MLIRQALKTQVIKNTAVIKADSKIIIKQRSYLYFVTK